MFLLLNMIWNHVHRVFVTLSIILFSDFNQVRFAHTDVPFPDFSYYRRDGTKAVKGPSPNSEARKAFTYMMLAGLCIFVSDFFQDITFCRNVPLGY